MHKNAFSSDYSFTTNNDLFHLMECKDCNNIVSKAHSYENNICTDCGHKLETKLDKNSYDIEYLNFDGYPKDKVILYRNKETKEIEDIQFNGFWSSYSSDRPETIFRAFGYNAYVEKEKT